VDSEAASTDSSQHHAEIKGHIGRQRAELTEPKIKLIANLRQAEARILSLDEQDSDKTDLIHQHNLDNENWCRKVTELQATISSMQNVAQVHTTECHVANDELNHVREQLHKAQEELKETRTALVKADNLLAANADVPKDLRLLPKQADDKVAASEKASRDMARVNAARTKATELFTKGLRETEEALSSEQKARENLEGEVDQLEIIHQDAEEEVGILRLSIVAMNEELATFSKGVGYASSEAEPAGQNIPDDIAMTYRKLKWDGKQTDLTSMELTKYNACHSFAVRVVDMLAQDLSTARKKITEGEEVLQEQTLSVNKLRQQLTHVGALIKTRDNTIAELSKLQKESADGWERPSSLNEDSIDKAQKPDQDYVKLSQELVELNNS